MGKWLDKFNTSGVLAECSCGYKKKSGEEGAIEGHQCEDNWRLSGLASVKKTLRSCSLLKTNEL